MAVKIDEKTEIILPLKLVVGLGVVVVSVALFVFHIDQRISDLEKTIEKRSVSWDAGAKFVAEFKPHPMVQQTADKVRELEISIVKQQKDIEYLQK